MRMENHVEIHAPVERVYEALTDLDNIPKHFPGIREAHITRVKRGLVGSRVDLVTPDGHHTVAEVKRVAPRRSILLEDARGISEEFILHSTPEGNTQATEIITAPASAEQWLKEDAEQKLERFAREIESQR